MFVRIARPVPMPPKARIAALTPILKAIARTAVVVTLLCAAWFCPRFLPFYGENCLKIGGALIIIAVAGSILYFSLWSAGYGKLKRRLIDDYGERCFEPRPERRNGEKKE